MSSFSWLAVDRRQHRQMMELVDRFRDESTVDDLGFGRIRDAWADRLFPGTSTLHTRLRYALFVPWLLRRAERRHTPEEILADFREGEFQLMGALRRGMGEGEAGIIGRQAGRALRRVPSVIYWGLLTRWGIAARGSTPRRHAERLLLEREAARHRPVEEHDDGPRPRLPGHLDLGLPEAPHNLLQETTFALTAAEADYLRTMVTAHAPHSLLGHLALNRPADWSEQAPLPDSLEGVLALDLPRDLGDAVSAALRFSRLAHVASLLYNVLLAEASERTDSDGEPLAETYRADLPRAAGAAVEPAEAVRIVAERIREALAEIGVVPAADDSADRHRRWYGVAPVLLDLRLGGLRELDLRGVERAFAEKRTDLGEEGAGDLSSAMAEHLRWALRTHVAVRFGGSRSGTKKAEQREGSAREAYTSPFWPFVLASTSVGQEGLDFHTYSHAVVHWNLPSNPVDLEQREGRVHRYKGHAVRKNLAEQFGRDALAGSGSDVWADLFDAAVAAEPEDSVGLSPFWIYPGAAKVWRFVPAMPLSREKRRLGGLQRTLGAYRMVLGQPRQEELVKYAGEVDVDLTIDLRPGGRSGGQE